MPDAAVFAGFHFLRPWWLLTILPPLLVWWFVQHRSDTRRRWAHIVAPHLLPHLIVAAGDRGRFRPVHLIVLVVITGAIGAAGPAWQREVPPFSLDTAPLVIVLDLSDSMNASDVQPTRLHRGKQKVRDLLALRAGSRNALVVYSGSAHLVVPLSDDPAVFETFLAALSSDLMPQPGKDAAAALTLAGEQLAQEETPGSILFVTDSIGAAHGHVFAAYTKEHDDEILILAVGTSDGGPLRTDGNLFAGDAGGSSTFAALDTRGLRALADQAGVFVAGWTVDQADVRRIQRRVRSHLTRTQQEQSSGRWDDKGHWFAIPVAILGLFWFRKGWTIPWHALIVVLAVLLHGCAPAGDKELRFVDLWLTSDQQGRRAIERADFENAARLFSQPDWKGVAYYRGGDLQQAADWFARRNTPEASYNLGNAYTLLGRYEDAVLAYEAALFDRPGWMQARDNRDIALALFRRQHEQENKEQDDGGEPSLDPDALLVDEKGSQGETGRIGQTQLNHDQIAEMWMRNLQTNPADFLRRRFALEAVDQKGRNP